MLPSNFLPYIFIPMGFLCLFKPVFLLYLIISVPVLQYIPSAIGDFGNTKLFQLGSVSFYIIDYLVLIMTCIFIKTIISKKRIFFSVLKSPIAKIVILYFLWEILIGLLSFLKGFSGQNVLRRLSGESFVFIALLVPLIDNIDSKKDKFFQFSIILAICVVIFAVLKYSVFQEYQLTSSETYRTLAGSAVIIILFPLCYVLFYSDFSRDHRILCFLFFLFAFSGIHFAGHRSGWIVLFFILTVWYFSHENRLQLSWVPLWSAALVTVILIYSLSAEIKQRTLIGDFLIRISDTVDISNQTTQERLSKWKYSLSVISEKPLLGLGRFPVYTSQNADNMPLIRLFPELNRAPHNLIANKIVHEGLLGLLILTIFLYVIFRQRLADCRFNKKYYLFLKVFMAAFIIYSLFNTSFSNISERQFFFITVGLLNAEILKKPLLIQKY